MGAPSVDNIAICAPLWSGAYFYAPGELSRVMDSAARLLEEQRGIGAVVGDRVPRAFGLTVFADESFVDAYLEHPHPHLGKRLLLDAADPSSTSVLRLDQIAEGQRGRRTATRLGGQWDRSRGTQSRHRVWRGDRGVLPGASRVSRGPLRQRSIWPMVGLASDGSINGELAGGMVMSLMTLRDSGIVVVVLSNIAHANTSALGLKIGDAFAKQAR